METIQYHIVSIEPGHDEGDQVDYTIQLVTESGEDTVDVDDVAQDTATLGPIPTDVFGTPLREGRFDASRDAVEAHALEHHGFHVGGPIGSGTGSYDFEADRA